MWHTDCQLRKIFHKLSISINLFLCYNVIMASYSFEQQQYTSQLQLQRLSQAQIQTLNLLAMSSQDLRTEIYKTVAENPALEIVDDTVAGERQLAKKNRALTSDTTRIATSTQSGEEKSIAFQQMLEAKADERETLREHLLFQLEVMKLSPVEHEIGVRLIDNLDERGMHILAPVSLVSDLPLADEKMLAKMIATIQHFDPIGTCCVSIEESLFVQAKIIGNAPRLALFLLGGHLEMLDPPNIQRVQKKLMAFEKEQSKLVLANNSQSHQKDAAHYALFAEDITPEKIDEALAFIRSLNPRPTEQFGTSRIHYVSPDVYITKEIGHVEKDDVEKGIIKFDDSSYYKIRLANGAVPVIRIAPDFAAAAQSSASKDVSASERASTEAARSKKTSSEVTVAVEKAKAFIESISYRISTIRLVCCELVRVQHDFFEKGTGHLVPLTRREIAERICLHESTVSRMADSKYIQCAWGLFAVKYFFTSGVSRVSKKMTVEDASVNVALTASVSPQSDESIVTNKSASDKNDVVSREAVLVAIKKILASQQAGEKKLSDQKLADALAEQGIKIARRTVAKYRALLDVGSSYDR